MSRARSVAELGNQALNLSVTEGSLKVGTGITFENTGETQFSGIITATQFVGDGSGLTGITAAGSGVVVQEEGSPVGTAATINFVGTAVTATISDGVATVEISAGAGGGSGISNVVEDTTPQLGGNLDVNSKFITGTGGVSITGIITATTFSGSGASLTSIPAGQLTGTVADARLTTVSSSKLSGALPAISGASLTNLTGASEATYGSSTAVPVITVDSNGRISGISTTGVSGGGGGGGINNIVQDTTPQLGGDLDLNSKDITGTGRVNISGIITATTFSGSLATSDLSGTITNSQLAGSIANAKLTNTTVSYGGVELALGGSDATPAFNLSDATNIPAAQLTGSLPAISGSSLTGVVTSITAGSNITLTGGPAGSITIAAAGTIAGISTTGTSFFNQLIVSGVSTFNGKTRLLDDDEFHVGTNGSSGHYKFYRDSSNTHNIIYEDISGAEARLISNIGGDSNAAFHFFKGSNALARFSVNNAQLHSGGAVKFETTSAGAVVTGILTATTFSGSGASLTTLNASELDSGTIPDARFPATLPTASGANLTTLNASELDSGTIPDARFPATLPTVSGANLTGIAVTEAPVTSYTVTANGSSAYRFSGGGVDSSADDPDLYLIRGQKYRFNNTTGSSHPFAFRVSSGGNAYTSGITGSQNGIQFFTVPLDAPSSLVYQCTVHSGMVGNIYINGAKSNRDTIYSLTGTEIDPDNGGIQTKVAGTNTTFTESLSAGDSVVLHLEGGSSYTITWPTITWVTSSGNSAPTLTAKDVVVLWKISTTLYGAYAGSYA